MNYTHFMVKQSVAFWLAYHCYVYQDARENPVKGYDLVGWFNFIWNNHKNELDDEDVKAIEKASNSQKTLICLLSNLKSHWERFFHSYHAVSPDKDLNDTPNRVFVYKTVFLYLSKGTALPDDIKRVVKPKNDLLWKLTVSKYQLELIQDDTVEENDE